MTDQVDRTRAEASLLDGYEPTLAERARDEAIAHRVRETQRADRERQLRLLAEAERDAARAELANVRAAIANTATAIENKPHPQDCRCDHCTW